MNQLWRCRDFLLTFSSKNDSESLLGGGRRFQHHLKYGEGDLAPWHSLHRQQRGPDNVVQVSNCANPVGLMAHIKKPKEHFFLTCSILKTPWPTEPASHPALTVLQEWGDICRGWVGNMAIKGFPYVISIPVSTYTESTREREAQHPELRQPAAHTRGRGCDCPGPVGPSSSGEAPGWCREQGTHLAPQQGLPQGFWQPGILTHF